MDIITNKFAEIYCKAVGGSFLDRNRINWKLIDGLWIGKRSVWTKDLRSCWLEDTTKDNVGTWWCGEDADYNEVFKRNPA